MTLNDLCGEYQTIRPLTPQAAYLLRRTAVLYGAWLGREAATGDLDDLQVSRWLEAAGATLAAWTVAGHRTRILSLWRFASRRGHCGQPGEVRRCPAPEPMPHSWTTEQVRRLVDATRHLNARARAYFHALILAAYESGLRKGDLTRLRKDEISPSGVLAVRMHKTGRPHVVAVRPETAAEILALPGETPLRSPWSTGRTGEYWQRLRLWAGLAKGGLHQLRRTGATLIAAEHGEDAARSWLGHRSADMVAFYVDRTVTQPRPWLPPRVG